MGPPPPPPPPPPPSEPVADPGGTLHMPIEAFNPHCPISDLPGSDFGLRNQQHAFSTFWSARNFSDFDSSFSVAAPQAGRSWFRAVLSWSTHIYDVENFLYTTGQGLYFHLAEHTASANVAAGTSYPGFTGGGSTSFGDEWRLSARGINQENTATHECQYISSWDWFFPFDGLDQDPAAQALQDESVRVLWFTSLYHIDSFGVTLQTRNLSGFETLGFRVQGSGQFANPMRLPVAMVLEFV